MFGGSSNCRIMYIYIKKGTWFWQKDKHKAALLENEVKFFLKTRRGGLSSLSTSSFIKRRRRRGKKSFNKIFFFFFPLLPIISRPLRHSLSLDYLHNTDLCSLGNYSEQREQRAHRTFSFFSFLFLVSIYFPKFSIKSSDKENNT